MHGTNEYKITYAINDFIKKKISTKWESIDILYPRDIFDANEFFLEKLEESKIKWTIEEWVTIKWKIILEEWAILKTWTYIEWNVYVWKNSKIWPNTYLRWNTVIWENCKIWNAVEIKNSNIWNNTNIAHLSYVWDSIIWNNVNIWCWFISANLRNDWKTIRVMFNWKLINSNRRKLWVIIWNNAKTWVKVYSMPGSIIKDNQIIMPWEMLK